MINKISPDAWGSITTLLDHWFADAHTRDSFLPFDSNLVAPEIAKTAAALFKRGAAGLHDTATHSNIVLSEKNQRRDETIHALTSLKIDTFPHFSAWTKTHFSDAELASVAVILDSTLARLHPHVENHLTAHGARVFLIDCTEEKKSLGSVRTLYEQIAFQPHHIIVVGGGICCDLGGFLGGLLNCNITLVPTTLLALIDAGVGGKTAVNHPSAGKNQIGLFVPIHSIAIIDEFFTSLNADLVRQGLGEIMKHAWLSGSFNAWQPALHILLHEPCEQAFQSSTVEQLLRANIQFKLGVVMLDPLEENIRVMLNFGHTLAHLLERLMPISHGIAVVAGLKSMLNSSLIGPAPEGFEQTLDTLLVHEKKFFPLFAASKNESLLKTLLLQDKKQTSKLLDSESQKIASIRCVTPKYATLAQQPAAQRPDDIDNFLAKNITQMSLSDYISMLVRQGFFR